MTRSTNLATIERDLLLEEERREQARREDRWIEEGREETLRLATLRGEEIEAPQTRRGEQRKPLRRKTGLEWLHSKGRLTSEQKQAGDKYGEDYRIGEEVSVRSVLNDSVRGPSDGPTEFVGAAKYRLTKARSALNHNGMIGVCNAVCGIGLTVREFAGSRHDAEVCETTLLIALDLLATHYGMGR